ncbi:hypothetical protein HTV45_00355 [Streptomyces sp. CHD11]|uniref:hypothetical protein n=1 Tax=Streptomyces sp. CHD11 TaxID=2741325 RepID=UPI001BFC2A5E|nr:hypothetical protein [Streptomyces sp. CHD11]MBT3149376.1 hypothetical protein [Streptomyces sp. CHD11]
MIPLALMGGLFWPTVLAYTFLAGERATAQVAECHHGGGRSPLKCSGTWRTADGDTGSGGIYGLRRSDAGHAVEVRVGPLGPYRPGLGAAAVPVSLSLFWLASFGVLTVQQVRVGRRARRLLAEPGAPGDLLIVTGKGARTLEGRRCASVVTLPWPAPATPGVKTAYWEVRDPAGQPMFRVEQRRAGKSAPELVVRDPSGMSGHIIRSTGADSPGACTVLAFDGTPVGSIQPFAGIKWGAFEFRDDRGVLRARSVSRLPEWVLRLEPGTSPAISRLVLAFVIGQRRRHK